MGLIDIASGNSTWRGLDYYKEHKVNNYKRISNTEYEGVVNGRDDKKYNVFMDIEHPRRSKCNCPHAKDKKIICKHIVALYFTVFTDEVDKFLKEVEETEKEYEEYEEKIYQKTIRYINSMSKSELKEALIELLDISPEWVYDRFVRDRVGYQ